MANGVSEQENSLRSLTREILALFFSSASKSSLEREVLKLAVGTLVGLAVLMAIGYWGFWSQSPQFVEPMGLLIVYLGVGMVAITATIWHLRCYYKTVSCSTSMMVGMVVGMLTGFLVGLIIGITNGMFVGAVVGILLGVLVGSWAGKCCTVAGGIMGVLEGQMAGFMAGPMGAMTSVMMLNDNYLLFIPIALVFIVMILAGLMFLLYRESTEKGLEAIQKQARSEFIVFLAVNLVLLVALVWLMMFGPKSALVQVVV